MNEVNSNEVNANAKAGADEKRRLDTPFPAIPGIFDGIVEQSRTRAKENCEKMKIASGKITDVLREAYSSNARGNAEYATKVIEFSAANTSSAFDFFSHLLGTKSPSEMLQLSLNHSRKNIETTAAQGRELWELAGKVATETAAPIRKSFASALQKTP